MLTRRSLLRASLPGALAAKALCGTEAPRISLGNDDLDATYRLALDTLQHNVQSVERFSRPVLLEGAEYPGVWLECAPLEGLAYEPYAPQIALNNHDVFFELQREDGYLPCSVKKTSIGTGQIQTVVPIAATAWDLYQKNRDAEFLERAYRACSRWDDWLMRYRNTRGTGLCEAFCTYDTGQDNSPRFAGKPNRCPDNDARICPKVKGLPYLAPDLSATVYGGRIALAKMARSMGRQSEEARWRERADQIRRAILAKLYDPETGAFYDRDSDGNFVKIRSVVITRVAGEHVPDQATFEHIYRLQIRNPHAFWPPYPIPSIAVNDPTFVRPIPRNSWGGASQALTALRTPRWMEHYGKYSDFRHLMEQWMKAIMRARAFLQQMDPETGESTPAKPGYSPAALVFLEFVPRLYGVRAAGEEIECNCRVPAGSNRCISETGGIELRNFPDRSEVLLHEKRAVEIEGEVRLICTQRGVPLRLVGTGPETVNVKIRRGGKTKSYSVRGDQVLSIANG
jgi:hypothetical protein